MKTIALGNKSLIINYKNSSELYDTLRSILGYTEDDIATKFGFTKSGIESWTRSERTPPKWILVYLMDAVAYELNSLGYILDANKSSFVVSGIKKIQDEMVDTSLSANFETIKPTITLDIDNLITDDKPINIKMVSNIEKILKNNVKDFWSADK